MEQRDLATLLRDHERTQAPGLYEDDARAAVAGALHVLAGGIARMAAPLGENRLLVVGELVPKRHQVCKVFFVHAGSKWVNGDGSIVQVEPAFFGFAVTARAPRHLVMPRDKNGARRSLTARRGRVRHAGEVNVGAGLCLRKYADAWGRVYAPTGRPQSPTQVWGTALPRSTCAWKL